MLIAANRKSLAFGWQREEIFYNFNYVRFSVILINSDLSWWLSFNTSAKRLALEIRGDHRHKNHLDLLALTQYSDCVGLYYNWVVKNLLTF